jgi:4-azaleucine resistance transporter AzlC
MKRKEFFAGVIAELPLLVGVAPFGMIFGILALSAGIPPVAAQSMSWIIFAGSSQFITAQLVGQNTPGLVIVLTAAIVNLRHMLYSASLAPYVKHLSGHWKPLLAYLLTDEAYAVTALYYQNSGPATRVGDQRHWYFLGSGLTLWTTWQLSTAVGVFIGAQVPSSWPLDFSLALTFIALLVPSLADRPAWGATLAAGVTAVLAYSLPYKLGLAAAALVGILVGLWLERQT